MKIEWGESAAGEHRHPKRNERLFSRIGPAEPNLDVPREYGYVQCTTYNTHKSGKPENSEIQKKMFPSILFLRIAGILPTAIIGI